MADEIWFGNAFGEYCNIQPERPAPVLVFTKRPDQDGEDMKKFGRVGPIFTGQVIIFGNNLAEIENERRKWEEERGQEHTLYMTSGGARGQWQNVVLTLARPLGRPKRIYHATNSASWMQRLTLNFKQREPV